MIMAMQRQWNTQKRAPAKATSLIGLPYVFAFLVHIFLALLVPANAATLPQLAACQPHFIGSSLASTPHTQTTPPSETDWQPVTLPFTADNPALGSAALWFRVQWQLDCTHTPTVEELPALGLAISGINQAGEVYWNGSLLWRSQSLEEPLSRAWNTPRYWQVTITDPKAIQTLLVRVIGHSPYEIGLGHVDLGQAQDIEAMHLYRYSRQQTAYLIAASLAAAVACIALVVWSHRRQEKSYFWLGSMQAFWALYLSTILAQETWPGFTSLQFTAFSLCCLVIYAQCFVMFTFRFGGEVKPRIEQASWCIVSVIVVVILLGAPANVRDYLAFIWCGIAFFSTGLYFQWRAWCTRKPQHLLLAICWLVVLVLGVHDSAVALNEWYNFKTLSAFFSPVIILMLGVLLGWKVAEDMRRIDGFNLELQQRVTQAQEQLSQSLAREHAQALQHAKVQERIQLAHDLHDGLGGTLVRSMAMLENAPQPVGKEHMLSMLKSMRDDLRQIIDAGSESGAQVPATPPEWLAPLRHRVTRVLESLNVEVRWNVDAQWQQMPSAAQCLSLLRIAEECFANIIKHSHAKHVQVLCTQSAQGVLCLRVQDDGTGFDVHAMQNNGMSVGMRSMQARAQRMGAQWHITSSASGTVMEVFVPVLPSKADADNTEKSEQKI